MERWASVKELLHQAMQLSPEQRGPFLDEACSSDISLRAELESLLSAEEKVRSSFLESPPVGNELAGSDIETIGRLEAGQVFAQRFRLVRKLGEGGMGQVWLAEQTSPVRRQVALKLIKAGMYDEDVVRRFQSERQSLAIMDHPAIARVFDAGTTEQGQPYFVMEYVPGLPITEYCDQKKLTIKQRLNLFIQVCEGVQHAHQKAIIHRDLKPPNILVVEIDGKPRPRIIDFGLAKATSPQLDGEGSLTQLGSLVGTPGYMSPEQIDPGERDIDTRTDVYSLGVILYVLLTGVLPIDTRNWQQKPLVEVLQLLREEEPERPSTKVSTKRADSDAVAAARGTESAQLVSLLCGDLDWIAMKALEKDREGRYGTPSEFASDIQRYLNHEPVIAREASAAYRMKKYIRRHSLAVSVIAAAVTVLVVFVVFQTVELRRITRERDRANRERDRANRVSSFVVDMFKVSDPSESRGNSVTAREILDKASKDIENSLTRDPELQAQLMYTMGNVYASLGLDSRSGTLLEQALNLQKKILGPEHPDTLDSASSLGRTLRYQGHYPEAEQLLRQTVQAQERVLGPEDPRTLRSMNGLANTLAYEGKNSEAEQLMRNVLGKERRVLGPEDKDTLKSMRDLSVILREEGHFSEAKQLQAEALALHQRVFGRDHPDTVSVMVSLGNTLLLEGHLAEAEKLVHEILAIELRMLGPEHPDTLTAEYNLTRILVEEGKYEEANKLIHQTLTTQTRVLGPDHLSTLRSMDILGEILEMQGRYSEAESVLSDALARKIRAFGVEHPDPLLTMSDLGEVLDSEGKHVEAQSTLQKAYETRSRVLGASHSDTLYSMAALALTTAHLGRFAEAEALIHQAQEIESHSSDIASETNSKIDLTAAAIAARLNRREESLALVEQLLKQWPSPDLIQTLETDRDLESIRRDRRFTQAIDQAKQRVTKDSD